MTWTEPGPDGFDVEVRRVQPYEAVKAYLCPGCHRDIPAGLGHLVAVPTEAPDLRRHWHKGCWDAQSTAAPERLTQFVDRVDPTGHGRSFETVTPHP